MDDLTFGGAVIPLDVFRKNFPPDAVLPHELIRLLEYQNNAHGFYSGSFELMADGAEATLAWFDGDHGAAAQFATFGQGPDGSLYSYWRYAGQPRTTAPIVLLDSEGVGSAVIANSTRDLLALLALGDVEPGRSYTDPEDEEYLIAQIDDNLLRFRAWLLADFGITVPASKDEIVLPAQRVHPKLDAWIETWIEQRDN